MCAHVWLELLIGSDSPAAVFDAICELEKLQVDLNWTVFIEKLKSLAGTTEQIELSSGEEEFSPKYSACIAQEMFKLGYS